MQIKRLLTVPQLKEKGIPWCRDHLRRKAKAGEFPAPIPISDSRIAWDEAEIDAWIERRRELRPALGQAAVKPKGAAKIKPAHQATSNRKEQARGHLGIQS